MIGPVLKHMCIKSVKSVETGFFFTAVDMNDKVLCKKKPATINVTL